MQETWGSSLHVVYTFNTVEDLWWLIFTLMKCIVLELLEKQEGESVNFLGMDTSDIDIMIGTCTKSFGSSRGYIVGSKDLIKYLKAVSPGHLYATTMSPPAAQQVISALKVILEKMVQIEEYWRSYVLYSGSESQPSRKPSLRGMFQTRSTIKLQSE